MFKMVKLKRILTIMLVMLIMATTIAPASMAVLSSDTDSEKGVIADRLIQWARDVFWEVWKLKLGKLNDFEWANHRPAVRNVTARRIELTTGGIIYNSGEMGNMSRIDVEANSSKTSVNMDITLTAETTFTTGLTNTINVLLTHVSSNTDVISKTLGYNGLTAYAIKTQSCTGEYSARFSTTETHAWDCGVIVYDYNAGSSGGNVEEPYSQSDEYVIDSKNLVRYLVPSDTHSLRRSNPLKRNIMNVDMLYSEMYDLELNDFVYQFKTMDIGDTVYVTDVIDKLTYNPGNDRTIFEFNTKYGNVTWPFDGNLLDEFKEGDTVSFKFNVVREFSDNNMTFENIDYAKKAMDRLINGKEKSGVVDIYDYLIRN